MIIDNINKATGEYSNPPYQMKPNYTRVWCLERRTFRYDLCNRYYFFAKEKLVQKLVIVYTVTRELYADSHVLHMYKLNK